MSPISPLASSYQPWPGTASVIASHSSCELVEEGTAEDGVEEAVDLGGQGGAGLPPGGAPEDGRNFHRREQRAASIGELRGCGRRQAGRLEAGVQGNDAGRVWHGRDLPL